MSNNPINLLLRFVLELAGLFALGYWGWTQYSGLLRWLLAIGAPLLAAAAWGIFRFPGDTGKGLVAVPGQVRLVLEAIYFSLGTAALSAAGQKNWGLVFGTAVVLHYLLSWDRVNKLMASNRP